MGSCLPGRPAASPATQHDLHHPTPGRQGGTNGSSRKMHQLLKQDMTPRANQSGLLAPDTTGMNFYRADPALTDLLRLYLPDALFSHIEPHLDRLGGLAGGYLDECARLAD